MLCNNVDIVEVGDSSSLPPTTQKPYKLGFSSDNKGANIVYSFSFLGLLKQPLTNCKVPTLKNNSTSSQILNKTLSAFLKKLFTDKKNRKNNHSNYYTAPYTIFSGFICLILVISCTPAYATKTTGKASVEIIPIAAPSDMEFDPCEQITPTEYRCVDTQTNHSYQIKIIEENGTQKVKELIYE